MSSVTSRTVFVGLDYDAASVQVCATSIDGAAKTAQLLAGAKAIEPAED